MRDSTPKSGVTARTQDSPNESNLAKHQSDEELVAPGWAPEDPLDGRLSGQWKSRYPKEAARKIKKEAVYLGLLLLVVPPGMVLLNTSSIRGLIQIPEEEYRRISLYGLAWLGGLLGGTLFALKWLYHVVAREYWNEDRVYWRIFTPHISAGLAFATVALISSGMFRIFDPAAMQSKSLIVGISFLIGYFSDSAVAKLTEIAQTIFGASRDKEKHFDRFPEKDDIPKEPNK